MKTQGDGQRFAVLAEGPPDLQGRGAAGIESSQPVSRWDTQAEKSVISNSMISNSVLANGVPEGAETSE